MAWTLAVLVSAQSIVSALTFQNNHKPLKTTNYSLLQNSINLHKNLKPSKTCRSTLTSRSRIEPQNTQKIKVFLEQVPQYSAVFIFIKIIFSFIEKMEVH